MGVSFPNYYRTKDEFPEGIQNNKDITKQLKIISTEERTVQCPYRELYISGKLNTLACKYAKWLMSATKSWSHSTFKSGLKNTRSKDEKEEIMEQSFGETI